MGVAQSHPYTGGPDVFVFTHFSTCVGEYT